MPYEVFERQKYGKNGYRMPVVRFFRDKTIYLNPAAVDLLALNEKSISFQLLIDKDQGKFAFRRATPEQAAVFRVSINHASGGGAAFSAIPFIRELTRLGCYSDGFSCIWNEKEKLLEVYMNGRL